MPKTAAVRTALEVARLKTPGLHMVGVIPGLGLQVGSSGSRSWVLRHCINGRRREHGLGPYPEVTLAQAREAARKARAKIREGVSPIDAARSARHAESSRARATRTFAQVAQAYVESHAFGWRNEKHVAQWLSTLQTYAYPVLGGMALEDIDTTHVKQVLDPIWSVKHETARRVRGRIESILSYGDKEAGRERLNPARWSGHLQVLLPPSNKVARRAHHPSLAYAQVPAFMKRLRQIASQSARALEFAILCASRSGEVRHAAWSEFNLATAEWILPGERMKNGKPHRVPLSAAAVAIVKAQPRVEGSDLVFPGAGGGPLSDMALTQLCRRLGVEAVPHGFRSSFRTWAGETTNFAHEVIEAALAHALKSETEAAYMRGDLLEKRRKLMAAWANYCARVGGRTSA